MLSRRLLSRKSSRLSLIADATDRLRPSFSIQSDVHHRCRPQRARIVAVRAPIRLLGERRVSDQNLRRAGQMSGIFIYPCLANYVLAAIRLRI